KMARSSPLLSLLVVILALVSFVQASFGRVPLGPRRIHREGEVLTALNKAIMAPVNIVPGRGHGQAWEIIETKDEHIVHIYQMDSGLFLSPQNPEDPSNDTPLVLSPFPQEWRLAKCDDCREEEDRFFIELAKKVNGKVLVVDNSRINVYPPMAGLSHKENGNKRQMWKLDEPNEQGHRDRWSRLEWQ
ncbi:hypothetical protein BGX26_004802, partial [Mortierella sp. AD094]